MPTPGYMSIEGTAQGKITSGAFTADSVGNIWQKGHEDEILVQAFSHKVTTPTDPQSGQASGQRVHKPMVITKVFDKSSPMLYIAQCTNELLKEVVIKWFRTNAKGQLEHYFTHKLTDATIVDITARMPNCQDPSQAHFTHLEDVSFAYRKIEWTHEKCGTSGEDDWQDRK
jgi:type VI secretion system secreted protein Hcp